MSNNPTVIFVNNLDVSGFLNGNVNLSFSTHRFVVSGTVDQEGRLKVDPDSYVSALLRMDLYVAQQLHEALGKIIAEQTKPGTVN